MNSLVVLLSVLAFATAKPSGLLNTGAISYTAPAIATLPAAVSQQSRIDIKSSPAVISTAAVAPIARTIIAEPAVISPSVVAAPAAVSSQSRIDIKSSPAVISSVAAPLAYSAPIAVAPTLIKSAIAAPAIAAPAFATPALAAPALLNTAIAAPGFLAPALAAPGVPLDTPEVIAARNAHFEAKALAGAHLIHKRSAPLIAAPIISAYRTPIVSTYSSPLVLQTPLITKAYSVHPW